MGARRGVRLVLAGVLTVGSAFTFAGSRGLGTQKLFARYRAVPDAVTLALAWCAAAGTAYGMLLSRGETIFRGLGNLLGGISARFKGVASAASASASAELQPRRVSTARLVMRLVGLHRLIPFKPAAAALFVLPWLGVETSSTEMLVAICVIALSDIPTYTAFTVGKSREAMSYLLVDYVRPDYHVSTSMKLKVAVTAVFVSTSFYGSTFFLSQKGLSNISGLQDADQRTIDVLSHCIALCGTTINVAAKVMGLFKWFMKDAVSVGTLADCRHPRWLIANTIMGDGLYLPAFFFHTTNGLLNLAGNLHLFDPDTVWAHVICYLFAVPGMIAEREFTVRHIKDACFSDAGSTSTVPIPIAASASRADSDESVGSHVQLAMYAQE